MPQGCTVTFPDESVSFQHRFQKTRAQVTHRPSPSALLAGADRSPEPRSPALTPWLLSGSRSSRPASRPLLLCNPPAPAAIFGAADRSLSASAPPGPRRPRLGRGPAPATSPPGPRWAPPCPCKAPLPRRAGPSAPPPGPRLRPSASPGVLREPPQPPAARWEREAVVLLPVPRDRLRHAVPCCLLRRGRDPRPTLPAFRSVLVERKQTGLHLLSEYT